MMSERAPRERRSRSPVAAKKEPLKDEQEKEKPVDSFKVDREKVRSNRYTCACRDTITVCTFSVGYV